jgi:hypothetical protein
MSKTHRQTRDDYIETLRFPLVPANPRGDQAAADDHDDNPFKLALDAISRLRYQERTACNELYHQGPRAVLSTYRWSQLQESILELIATIVPILDRIDDRAHKTLD